jgi:hypothetical protein
VEHYWDLLEYKIVKKALKTLFHFFKVNGQLLTVLIVMILGKQQLILQIMKLRINEVIHYEM